MPESEKVLRLSQIHGEWGGKAKVYLKLIAPGNKALLEYQRIWYWRRILTPVGPLIYHAVLRLLPLAWLGKAVQWIMNKLGT